MGEGSRQELLSVCAKLRLKSPTKHLAHLLSSHYLASMDNVSVILKGREIILSAILVAAKMRERDIECPTVSVVAKAGSRIC